MERVGTVLGGVIFGAVVLLIAVYGTGDRTMPDWLFWITRTTLVGIILVGVPPFVFIKAVVPAWRFHKTRRYQWPVVNRRSPPLYKKLIDMEDADRHELEKCLFVEAHRYIFVDMENVTPYLQLYITVRNESVFTLAVSSIMGQVTLDKIAFDPVEDENTNWRKVARRQPYQISLRQELDAERIAEVREAAKVGRLDFGLARLSFKIKIDEPGAPERELRFGLGMLDETTTFTKMGD